MKINILTFASILVCLLFVSCKQSAEQPADEHQELKVSGDTITITPAQRNRIRLTTQSIAQQQVTTDLAVNGRIEVPPQDAARIGAPMGGMVRSISVLQGSHVRRGQTIFTLEHADFISLQREYLTTVSRLEVLQKELERQQALAAEQINASKVLEQVTGEVRTLRIQRKSLHEQLALIRIDARSLTEETITRTIHVTSPIDGYVTGVYAVTGAYITPSDSLADIVSLRHLHAELFVFERDISGMHEGQKFSATINDARKTRVTGRIHLVGRGVEADRTVRVHGHLDPYESLLLPGTTLSATVASDPRTALIVPSNALISDAEGTWVFIEERENTYVRIKVMRGVSQGDITELQGAPPELVGRKVVTRGVSMLNGAFAGGGEHGH